MTRLACLDPCCPIDTQAALESFVAFSRQLMDFHDIGWWCIHYDLDPDYFYCNDAMNTMFGLDPSRYRHSIAETCPIAGDFNRYVAKVDQAVADKVFVDYEALLQGKAERYDNIFPFRAPEGTIRYFRSQAMVLQRDEQGRPTLIQGLIVEITLEVELQQQLQADKLHYKRLSELDGLTGLFNHTTLLQLCEKQLHEARRTDRPFSIWYLDLDFFKAINDEAGHAEGDRVLRDFARFLKAFFDRPNDIVGRLGGEEFLACTLGPDFAAVQAMKQRFQQRMKDVPIVSGRKSPPHLTVSGGIIWMDPLQIHCTLDELIHQADMLLYQAKQQGRDRLILSHARC
ncbi:diguanylate cyclase (GGDEF) domain-containing protein [Sulfurivirga caldicuralii]|uniref:diguanylate cyclase n=1 Tax=Sulfurivirga caldicuralii TaxID=364032 RepID=A0A1N6DI87_9GAMM|nr:sensor domain-containing diguanylate cyclase [Sulfurivirga caldicuralii]SIN70539.1 diguanylate cyclase (GGDEF) domain-containing protein [Sulfurivirga caldicuralii]